MGEGISNINSILWSSRPFKEAKEQGKILCAEYFQRCNEIKLFLKGSGLTQHFKIKHRSIKLVEGVTAECKAIFQHLHGQETYRILEQLSEVHLQMVRLTIKDYLTD